MNHFAHYEAVTTARSGRSATDSDHLQLNNGLKGAADIVDPPKVGTPSALARDGYKPAIAMCLMGAAYSFVCPFPGGYQHVPGIFTYAMLTGIAHLIFAALTWIGGRKQKEWPIVLSCVTSCLIMGFNNVNTYLVVGFDGGVALFFLVPVLYCAYFYRIRLAYLMVAVAATSTFFQCYLGRHDVAAANTRALIIVFAFSATAWLLNHARMKERDLRDQIEEQACTDHLTHLLNRRGLQRWLGTQDIQQAAVILLDIDHFKYVNDTYGHDCGDKTLTHLAQALQLHVRDSDAMARMGGEEFVCIMPSASTQQAINATARISRALRESCLMYGRVTVSYGIAEWRPGEVSFEDALKCADRALYTAKQNGRNQTRLNDSHSEPILVLLHSA